MFQHQIEKMREDVKTIKGWQRPPENVFILKEQADYLGVKRVPRTPGKPKRSTPVSSKAVPKNIVKVRLLHLYVQLMKAKGVDQEDESDVGEDVQEREVDRDPSVAETREEREGHPRD